MDALSELSQEAFWRRLDELVAASRLCIDRPAGTRHPRYPDFIYPCDYGFLEDTRSPDGQGIDVWRGSLPDPCLSALLCTVDILKRDSEIKLLLGCTEPQTQQILAVHNSRYQSAVLIRRPNQAAGTGRGAL